MVSPRDAFVELAALGHAKIFGSGHAACSSRAAPPRAVRAQHAVRGFTAERLLPGERHHIELGPIELLCERRRGASQMVRPSRLALIQSALGTRTPEVVPFQ